MRFGFVWGLRFRVWLGPRMSLGFVFLVEVRRQNSGDKKPEATSQKAESQVLPFFLSVFTSSLFFCSFFLSFFLALCSFFLSLCSSLFLTYFVSPHSSLPGKKNQRIVNQKQKPRSQKPKSRKPGSSVLSFVPSFLPSFCLSLFLSFFLCVLSFCLSRFLAVFLSFFLVFLSCL